MRDRGRDAAGAGAEVENAWRFEAWGVSGELQNVFYEGFGVGARDERVARDVEREVEEVGPAGEVGNGLLLGGAGDEAAELLELGLGEGALVVGVKFDPRVVQHMGGQEFGGEARGVDVFSGEEARG